jgi:phosphatidate cytidylyltransferase
LAALSIPLPAWLVMASLVSFVAQSGDFFESLLKRVAEVKDSGRIMPGHGGILDRIDGLLFAAPVMSVALSYFDQWI